ncbi:MAG: 3-methyl-2-oxobutanoate hydroxymethyltransferase [Candidatus Omnitrophota bacterium]
MTKEPRKKITIADLMLMKQNQEKITMLTAYDYPLAVILDQAEIDIILVGDSVGNVILGYDSTVRVTMDEMVHHTKAVRKGTKYALLVADMPFMSFNVSKEQTIINAGRLIKEAEADAVKVEGGTPQVLDMIRALVGAGIPVMGHLGLTPQTATMLSGFKVQGKNAQAAQEIIQQSQALEKAGCFSIVFECIPDLVAKLISQKLKIPTIGIGAGSATDGQVLVTHDMLGLYDRFKPKFVKQYTKLAKKISTAVKEFVLEVQTEKFPDKEHSFTINTEEFNKLK